MIKQVMDCLVDFDIDTQTVKPSLAHTWHCNDLGTQWRFYLRPGIQFHHGRALNAQDVAHTLNHLKHTPSPFHSLYQHIENINCINPLCVEIDLSKRDYLFLNLLANHSSSIQPYELMHEVGFYTKPVGTGPFKISRNDQFQLELTAFEEYFRERALLDRIDIWFFDEQINLEQTSDIYLTDTGPNDDADMQHNSKIELGYQYLLFNVNNQHSALQELRIRRSIRAMLDTTRMVSELGGVRAAPARRLLPEWEAISQRLMFAERPRMPMRLQKPFILVTYDVHMEDAQWIQQALHEFDIALEIQELPYEQFANPENWHHADLILSGEALDDNIEMALYQWFASKSSLRHCMGGEHRERMDSMLLQAASKPKRKARMEAFREMDIYLQQQLVLMPLYHYQQQLHYGNKVQGLYLNSLGWVDFKNVWFS